MATKPIDEFEIEVVRVARVKVLAYQPPHPGRVSGPPEDCYEPTPEDIEFELLLDVGRGVVVDLEPTDDEREAVLDEYRERCASRRADARERDE